MLDQAARESALTRGRKVIARFARRDVSAARWIADLSPYLTPAAAQAYAGTDPSKVPPTKVTGKITLTRASTPLVARVSVPTDAGVYLLIMARDEGSPSWLTDRILPPEGPGDS